MKSALKVVKGASSTATGDGKAKKKTLKEIEEEFEKSGQKVDFEDGSSRTYEDNDEFLRDGGSPWENIQAEKQRCF